MTATIPSTRTRPRTGSPAVSRGSARDRSRVAGGSTGTELAPTTVARKVSSPVGVLTLAGGEDGSLTNLSMEEQSHPPADMDMWVDDPRAFQDAADQLEAYFSGELTTFDVPLLLAGSPFQLRVWEGLRTIPYGETCSYGELAEEIGKPGAARAVGLANGRNPISIIVPCHRVIGADGSLTGYGGGLWRKKTLLDLERARHSRS